MGKNYGEDGKDTKNVTIVQEPAAERGVGMLSFSYDDTQRDNETWLDLSAPGKAYRQRKL